MKLPMLLNLRFLFTLLFFLYSIISLGLPPSTTYTSTGTSGDWKTGSKWSIGSSPAFNQTTGTDIIIIDNSHKITLTDVLSVKSGTTITITSNDTLEINGDVTFANGSVVNVNSNGVLIINGNLTNNNNSNTITINGTLAVNGNFSGGQGSEVIGTGSMAITGTVTTTGTGAIFGSTADCSTPGSCSSSFSSPLPIVLAKFDVSILESVVKIEWITSSEINNDYFTIEKSQNGEAWNEISTIDGAGNSNLNIKYSYIDNKIKTGTTYYRLKQTDFNGEFSYSKIKAVNYKKTDVSIFPNPIKDVLNISSTQENIQIKVISTTGQTIFEGSTKTINTSNWSKGLYTIFITDNGELINTSKVIK